MPLSEIEDMNNLFTEITKNFLAICSVYNQKEKFLKNTNNNSQDVLDEIFNDNILLNEIIQMKISMFDLSIQMQNIKFKLEQINDNSNTTSITTNNTKENTLCKDNKSRETELPPDTDKLINTTIQQMLPLMMLALMNNDANSILNSNTFMNNFKNNIAKISKQSTEGNISNQNNDNDNDNDKNKIQDNDNLTIKKPYNPDDLD